MKKLPKTIDSCGHCPFRIVYPSTDEMGNYQDYCRLTGNRIYPFVPRIPTTCPLEDAL